MNILVTGGAGFIGSHLVRRLLKRGDTVTVVDNISTGRIENLSSVIDDDRLDVIIDTVTNPVLMEELIRASDHVYHLAAPVGVKYIMDNPVKAIVDNVRAVDVVFEFCNKYRRKVLLASSSEVYGKNLDHLGGDTALLGEDDYRLKGSTKNQRWAYAATKSLDEFLAFAYHREFKMPVVVVRFFNTVGPGQTGVYGMVLPSFVQQAMSGGPIVVYGTGKQSRSFLHVADALDAIVALMDEPAAIGEVFNVGHGREVNINDLAGRVQAIVGSEVEVRHIDYKSAYGDGFEDMMRRAPDTTRVNKLVGFKPKFDLDDIIRDVYEEMKG